MSVVKLKFVAKLTILVSLCPLWGTWAAFLDLKTFVMRWIKETLFLILSKVLSVSRISNEPEKSVFKGS